MIVTRIRRLLCSARGRTVIIYFVLFTMFAFALVILTT